MKKIFHWPKTVLKLLAMLLVINSCSKKDSTTPSPIIPPPVVFDPPTGTAQAKSSVIDYDGKDTITYSFINADSGVWVNNVFKGLSQTGVYYVDSLKTTRNFYIKGKGKGGTITLTVHITVGQNPKITFVTSGTSHFDSILYKPYNGTQYINIPTTVDCPDNTHTFYLNGLTSTTNEEWTLCGNCTSIIGNPGDNVRHDWYFDNSGHFFWHGLDFDTFTINGNEFILHEFAKVTIGGIDYWDEYKWYYIKN